MTKTDSKMLDIIGDNYLKISTNFFWSSTEPFHPVLTQGISVAPSLGELPSTEQMIELC